MPAEVWLRRRRSIAARALRPRYEEIDAVGIAVRLDHGDDRDLELARFLDRDVLLVRVDHEQEVRQAAHVTDAAKALVELVALAREVEQLLLGAAVGVATEHVVELAQAADRLGDGLPVGQRAAEPAVVDVVLRRALGGVGNGLAGLPLGADEEHAATLGDDIAHRDQRLMEQRHGLREVDDMDVIAGAEDEGRHFRVPAVALVAEVNASFEELTHIECRQGHA